MKKHSTNYYNTFIEVSEDCPVTEGVVPPLKGNKKTAALLQFEMIYEHPYRYTSDEVFFQVLALRKGFEHQELEEQKALFFSKGQPCFRASPLTKRYGWGVHSNEAGQVALYSLGSEAYQAFLEDDNILKKKAMRNKRKT